MGQRRSTYVLIAFILCSRGHASKISPPLIKNYVRRNEDACLYRMSEVELKVVYVNDRRPIFRHQDFKRVTMVLLQYIYGRHLPLSAFLPTTANFLRTNPDITRIPVSIALRSLMAWQRAKWLVVLLFAFVSGSAECAYISADKTALLGRGKLFFMGTHVSVSCSAHLLDYVLSILIIPL